jgi:putative sporulation protein YtxC
MLGDDFMESLRIGVNKDTKSFAEQILNTIKSENKNSVDYNYKKTTKPSDKINYLDITFKKNYTKPMQNKFELAISEWIVKKYEKKIIYKIINKKYSNLSSEEKDDILVNAIKNVETEENASLARRRSEIKTKISDYLKTSDKLFIEGFVRFRLKDYWAKLEEIVEESVKKRSLDKEYDDFIKLLQYFVQIQEPKVDFLHVVASKNGTYNFYDKLFMDITDECESEFIEEITAKQINYDDLLISTLIVLSPKKIVFHKSNLVKNKELMNTIIQVFGKKIKFCKSCEFCKAKKK